MRERGRPRGIDEPTQLLKVQPALPPRRARRFRFARTLTARTILVTCVSALVSVVVTALVALPLANRPANRQIQQNLSDEATLAGLLMTPRIASPRTDDEERLVAQMRERHIDVYVIRNGQPDRAA